jgi:hypothetical protein
MAILGSDIISTVCWIVGIILIIVGIVNLILYFNIVQGVLEIVIGIILVAVANRGILISR